jgi:A/B hydrolase-like, N-terminal domain
MEYSHFADLQKRLQELYQKKQFTLALQLATRQFDAFPQEDALLYYWRITMAAHSGDVPESLRLFSEALDKGVWYNEALLRKNPSLESMQGEPDFERLVKRNRMLMQAEQQVSYPLLTIRPEGCCQQGDAPCPLLLALHANRSNPQDSIGFWKPAANAGWLVAAPQSSQVVWKGAYVWDDRQIAENDIRKTYSLIRSGYSIDVNYTVLAGHSTGGEIAMWLALKSAVESAGFIAINPDGPYFHDLNSWEPLIRENLNGRLRGYIIIGENDSEIPRNSIRNLVDMFSSAGIPCQLEIIPDTGHYYVPQFDLGLVRALDFLTS